MCTNIGNLLLVRALRRSDEITLRRVLGAGYGQIVRQLLLESAVLAVLGGALGLVLARALLRILVALAPPELPHLDRIQIEGAPVGIAMLVTLASAILFGLAPALWAARANLAAPFRGGRSGGEVRAIHRARRVLVVWQVALALMIVAAAGLIGRSLDRLQRLDMGLDVEQLTILELSWSWLDYDSRDKVWGLYEVLLPAIRALPEVEHATPVLLTPFSGTGGWDVSPFDPLVLMGACAVLLAAAAAAAYLPARRATTVEPAIALRSE